MKCKDCYVYKQQLSDIIERDKDLCPSFVRVFGNNSNVPKINSLCDEIANRLDKEFRNLVAIRDTECPTDKCILGKN